MSCNSCAKSFSLLRKEKGCPGCGFSYCSKCLDNKIYLPKLQSETKVCSKCKKSVMCGSDTQKEIEPPDAYYRRIGAIEDKVNKIGNNITNYGMVEQNTTDEEIQNRLLKLRDNQKCVSEKTTDQDIAARLQNIKEVPSTSNAELLSRLAKLKGVPESVVNSKPTLPSADLRTEQEQADDLMKQYMEQANIDQTYKNEFDEAINNIELRMQKLKGASTTDNQLIKVTQENDSESEEDIIKRIIEKAKAEGPLEETEIAPSTNDELPFCEICNEDAKMRCLGCRYLFCKQCFQEHKDDDDGCNKYEPYEAPKDCQY